MSRWTPENVARARAMSEQGMTTTEIAHAFGKERTTVLNMMQRFGIPARKSNGQFNQPAPVPDDFAVLFPTMSRRKLADHYGRSTNTIAVWVVQTGLRREVAPKTPKKVVAKPARVKASPKRKPVSPIRATERQFSSTIIVNRDDSVAGRAADYLRRFSAVIRCDERGEYRENGSHWRRGSTVLSASDVIDRARRNGWREAA